MIIDCNTLFGYWQKDSADRSLRQLLRTMDAAGIDCALTCCGRGVWDSFTEGNRETLQACAAHPRLLPVATLRPGDYFQCREEIAGLGERGFRMIRFFPAVQGWEVRSLSFRRLVEALAQSRLPLFFDHGHEIAGLIAPLVDLFRGTDTPLVFSGVSYELSEFLAACELHEQCYTDTWQLFLLNQLELIRDEVGLQHVLFGTRAPFEMPGPCLQTVAGSRLSAPEREAVLSGNLCRLLGGGAGASAGPAADAAPPARPRAALPPLPPRVIDVHAHYGGWPGLPNPNTSLEDLLETVRRFHLEHCCLSSTLAIGYGLQEGNERLRQAIEGHPELHGYVVIHPGYTEQSLQQLDELLPLPCFLGAKLHPKHAGYHVDAPEARPLLRYLADRQAPLLVHTWFEEMCLATARAADEFPDLAIIMGHMGGDDWRTALEVAADRPNLYLELCSGLSPCGKLEAAVAAVGAERLLFGSDLTLLDPGYTLGLVQGAEISEEDKAKILYGNAQRLLGL